MDSRAATTLRQLGALKGLAKEIPTLVVCDATRRLPLCDTDTMHHFTCICSYTGYSMLLEYAITLLGQKMGNNFIRQS